MKIAVLGTGMVGNTIGSRLISLGHEVKMGSRTANNEKAKSWVKSAGAGASAGTFAEAAAFGEILFNCTSGMASLEALGLAGKENLKGKILVDVANPLDLSKGTPPSLGIVNTDSLGEAIQRTFPDVKVVKTLNTMNCQLMVDPSLISGNHTVFICGNDAGAKGKVREILSAFGWKSENQIDLGDITGARGAEQLVSLWVRLYGTLQHPMFNFQVVTVPAPPK